MNSYQESLLADLRAMKNANSMEQLTDFIRSHHHSLFNDVFEFELKETQVLSKFNSQFHYNMDVNDIKRIVLLKISQKYEKRFNLDINLNVNNYEVIKLLLFYTTYLKPIALYETDKEKQLDYISKSLIFDLYIDLNKNRLNKNKYKQLMSIKQMIPIITFDYSKDSGAAIKNIILRDLYDNYICKYYIEFMSTL